MHLCPPYTFHLPQTIERGYIQHFSDNQAKKPNYGTHIRNHRHPSSNVSYHVTVPDLLFPSLISITTSRLCGAGHHYYSIFFSDFKANSNFLYVVKFLFDFSDSFQSNLGSSSSENFFCSRYRLSALYLFPGR